MKKWILIYDGDCGFCRRWILRWQKAASELVGFEPYQSPGLLERFPETSRAECEQSVVLIDLETREKWVAAHAVFQLLATNPKHQKFLQWHQHVPLVRPVSEWCYRLVAGNRTLFSKLSAWLLEAPESAGDPTYLGARWLFLRVLAFGFAAGFLSLSRQIHGLIGPRGILPAHEYLQAVAGGVPGFKRFLIAPSFMWLTGAGSFGLELLWWGGFLAAICLLFNLWPRVSAFLCWFFYLSYTSVANNFSGFQSDALMLETGLLAVLIAPRGLRPGFGAASPPTGAGIFMLRWLLFRLMFESGMVKLLSGDPSWRRLTALKEYYENCPFPTWIGWYVQHLPSFFHSVMAAYALFVEAVLAFGVWIGRRVRMFTFWAWALFQIGILLTGNYTFLNVNAIMIALFLVDDRAMQGVARFLKIPRDIPQPSVSFFRKAVTGCLFSLIFYVSGIWFLATLSLIRIAKVPEIMLMPVAAVQHFQSANRYGLFASMTHERKHIEFEGSDDGGMTWKTYEFKWQPQKLDAAPRFMAPHLPRFDWNLWFAVLGSYRQYPFVIMTARRLIEGEPAVLKLFKNNPFRDHPPMRIRFPLTRYYFTDIETKNRTGNYWRRTPIGFYAPTLVKDPTDDKFKLVNPTD